MPSSRGRQRPAQRRNARVVPPGPAKPRLGLRRTLWHLLETDDTEEGELSWVNWLLILLVLISFFLLAVETEYSAQVTLMAKAAAGELKLPAHFQPWPRDLLPLIHVGQVVLPILFAIEYVIRLMVCGENPRFSGPIGRARYAMQPMAICDLLAFLPELLVMAFWPAVGAAHLAGLRMLRLLRLFKLIRYMPGLDVLVCAFQRAKPQLLVTLMFAGVLLFVAAAMLHFLEGGDQPQNFGSIPRALWWSAVTLTTIGYGDAFPITPFGKLAAAITALAGIALVALPTGIFASAISDELKDRMERQEESRKRRAAAEPKSGT